MVYRDSITNRSNPNFKIFQKSKKDGDPHMKPVNGDTFRIRLLHEQKQWLFAESERTGKTVSQLIRDAIEQMRFKADN